MSEKANTSSYRRYSIESLRLDVDSAMAGKTWLLLPSAFRASGKSYPLPSKRIELQLLSTIPIPAYKKDDGVLYIKRAIGRWKLRQTQSVRNEVHIQSGIFRAEQSADKLILRTKELRQQAKQAVDEVREEAQKASASLGDLFSLIRKGLNGMIKAHIAGEEWHGSMVTKREFLTASAVVIGAVKGLGIPSGQGKVAKDVIQEQVAAAIREMQETLALAPGSTSEN